MLLRNDVWLFVLQTESEKEVGESNKDLELGFPDDDEDQQQEGLLLTLSGVCS